MAPIEYIVIRNSHGGPASDRGVKRFMIELSKVNLSLDYKSKELKCSP